MCQALLQTLHRAHLILNPVEKNSIFIPHFTDEHTTAQKGNNLRKVTQLGSCRARLWIKAGLQSRFCNQYAELLEWKSLVPMPSWTADASSPLPVGWSKYFFRVTIAVTFPCLARDWAGVQSDSSFIPHLDTFSSDWNIYWRNALLGARRLRAGVLQKRQAQEAAPGSCHYWAVGWDATRFPALC